MKNFVMLCACMCALNAHAKNVAVLVVSTDKTIDAELLDDTTESIGFQIVQRFKFNIIPKERLAGLIGFKNPARPGGCFLGEENTIMSVRCLWEAANKTSADYALIVRVIAFRGVHKLEIHTIFRGSERQNVYSVTRHTVNVTDVRAFIEACSQFVLDRVNELNAPHFNRIVRRIDFKPRRRERSGLDQDEIPIPSIVHSNKTAYTWTAVSSGVVTTGFMIAAIVLGVQAKDAEAEIARCANEPCPELQGSARDEFISDGEHKTDMANIMIGAASTFAVTTALFAVLSILEEDTTRTIPSVSITPLANGAHLNMSVSF